MSKPSASEIQTFIGGSFEAGSGDPVILIEDVTEHTARLRLPANERHLRPGATVSGPSQMMLADTAAWVLIMHNLGMDAAPSVTSNLNISFLLRPPQGDLIARAELLKLGKRLSVSEVRLYGEGHAEPVAHATVTYAVLRMSERKP